MTAQHNHLTWDIKRIGECHGCDAYYLSEALKELDQLRTIANVVYNAQAVMERYSGWWDGAPEDSWRLERDMRAALEMPPYDDEEDEFPAIDRGPVLPHPDHPIQTPYDF